MSSANEQWTMGVTRYGPQTKPRQPNKTIKQDCLKQENHDKVINSIIHVNEAKSGSISKSRQLVVKRLEFYQYYCLRLYVG